MPFVYFVQHPDDEYIKIGTTGNLPARLAQLRKEYGASLKLLGFMDGDKTVEKSLHQRFSADKRFGEWFKASDGIKLFVEQNTRPELPLRELAKRATRKTKRITPSSIYLGQYEERKRLEAALDRIAHSFGLKNRSQLIQLIADGKLVVDEPKPAA